MSLKLEELQIFLDRLKLREMDSTVPRGQRVAEQEGSFDRDSQES
jgi:hypothetical protein